MERHKNKYKAIDFFCGGGGMTCGLRQAGIDVVAGIEIPLGINKTLNN
jgi:DNA (cytosine-5)-methyltransferase 1